MGIVKLILCVISSLIIIILLRKINSEQALLASCILNISITVFSISILIPVFDYIKELTDNSLYKSFFEIMFKSAGVCLLCSFAGELCKDTGEASLGQKIELAGKCTLLTFSLPLIKTVFSYASQLVS